MLYIGGKKLRNRVKLSTKVKTCVPNLAVVRRFDCIVKVQFRACQCSSRSNIKPTKSCLVNFPLKGLANDIAGEIVISIRKICESLNIHKNSTSIADVKTSAAINSTPYIMTMKNNS